ncbi:MAG TPA: DUF1269 domain-containing protein [Thermomicrobiales bacterium]|nr:DUF1269 domain-containing protein [Thermomicrobiales bacterium]
MSKPAHLVAAVYPDREHAQDILDMLERMHHALTISLVDAALVTKDDQGKLQVHETKELTTRKGARRGAIIMGSLAVLFPPTIIASAIAGGAFGAIAGKLRDSGIKNKQLRELAERLEPGKAIVVALAEDDSLARVQSSLGDHEGELVVAPIDAETLIEINKAAVMKAGSGE